MKPKAWSSKPKNSKAIHFKIFLPYKRLNIKKAPDMALFLMFSF